MSDRKVLIIDDEVDVGTFFRRLLKKRGCEITVAVSGAEASAAIKEKDFDVAMVDLKLPDADGLSLLRQIKSLQPDCEVIIMTGYGTTRTAVKAIQLGAFDYLEKPFEDINQVEELICKAAEYKLRGFDGGAEKDEWANVAGGMGFMVGNSQAMRRLVSIAYKIARKNINVLIQGETGTGKEVLARFIHTSSNRSDYIFIPINCGALPENLLESELFGHEKGAFTGAANMRRGIFEMANRGTLFLDEVGESSPPIQVKLLRVLETGEFLRVGGEVPIKSDVRVIAATNVDLEQAIKDKTFREDLFYRLDVVRLELPPLRARREDIPLLAEHFVKKLNPELNISAEVLELLGNYAWPGNIRELSNTISQAVALCEGNIILPEHLGEKLVSGFAGGPSACRGPAGVGADLQSLELIHSLEAFLEDYSVDNMLETAEENKLTSVMDLLHRLENTLAATMRKKGIESSRPLSLDLVEAKAIGEALDYYQGNITLAARALGIGRNTLYRKMRDYGIKLNAVAK